MLSLGLARGSLALLLVTAALWDIRKRRIPNAISAAVLLTGLVDAFVAGGWRSAASGVGAAALTLAVLWFPWLKGRIGGGDVKLTTAAATWVGLSLLPVYLLGTACAGGLVALVSYSLSSRQARKEMAGNLRLVAAGMLPEAPIRGGEGRVSVPYGVASAAAALVVVIVGKGW